MYSQNEQIHAAAWPCFCIYEGAAYALGHQVNNAASMVYAGEGSCYTLAACAVLGACRAVWRRSRKEELLSVGGDYSVIYGPDGQELAERIPHDQEAILYAELNLHMIGYSKAVADPAGNYAKRDSTRLLVNCKKQPAVLSFDDANGWEEVEAESEK